MTTLIREEQPTDSAAIRRVNEKAFGRRDEAELVDTLRLHGAITLSLVAVVDDHIVGHILFSPVSIESTHSMCSAVGLGPMAVLPAYQQQGIGSQLVREGLDRGRQMDYTLVIVLGHPDYYSRFGFVPASRHDIHYKHDVPDEVFMVLELGNGAAAGCSGIARYHPAFDGV